MSVDVRRIKPLHHCSAIDQQLALDTLAGAVIGLIDCVRHILIIMDYENENGGRGPREQFAMQLDG